MSIRKKTLCLTFAIAIGLTACGAPATPDAPTALKIVEPAQGSLVPLNGETPVRVEYSGSGMAQVHLWVNGQKMGALPMQPGVSGTSMVWKPLTTGNHVLYVEARDAADQIIARSDIIAVRVETPTPAPAPTMPATLEPTLAPTLAPTVAPTVEPTLESQAAMTDAVASTSASSASAPAATSLAPTAAPTPGLTVVNEFVNLRTGPGTTYDLIGQLKQGQTARVTGKSRDGQWWQVNVEGKTVWVSGQFVQANGAANSVAVAPAPALPTPPPPPPPSPTAALLPLEPPAQAAGQAESPPATPSVAPAAQADDCNPSNPFWAARLNDAPDYTFCTPVPFEFVPNASTDPDEMVIRWHIYGIQSLELHVDPSGDDCGMGTKGMRVPVRFKEDNFRINRRDWPPGGYKIGLFATLSDGRIQDWGELHFCGK